MPGFSRGGCCDNLGSGSVTEILNENLRACLPRYRNSAYGTVRRLSDEQRCKDNEIAYPIRQGFPILLGLAAIANRTLQRDTKAPQYAEAYSEMEFYNAVGAKRAQQIRAAGS